MGSSITPISDGEIRRLTKSQRDFLIDHIDGEVAVVLANNHCISTVRTSLLKAGLLKGSPPNSQRPRATLLTERGRMAVGLVLADYADALVRAGVLDQQLTPLAVLRSLKALRNPPVSAETALEPVRVALRTLAK
jgi:hypothetical protein